jgi:hypothetical protein
MSDEAAVAVLGGIAGDQSRKVMVEFNGTAAHQIYHNEKRFEQLLKSLVFMELWVFINKDKIKTDDILIVRDDRSTDLLGIFTITEIDYTDHLELGELILRPLYVAA